LVFGFEDLGQVSFWMYNQICKMEHWLTKSTLSMCTGFLTFVVSFGSSVFSATTAGIAAEFHVSEEVTILGVTLYVIGFACGMYVLAMSANCL
jgi:hypothetical protein